MILLAPMEGVVDPIIRDLLTQIGGFDFCATEFVRVTHRLNPKHVFLRYAPELSNNGRTRAGVPVFIQLLGGDPIVMAENAALAAELGAPGIDLNFGCPAKTVNRHDGGSVILQWPERVFKISSAVRQAVPDNIPVTVKVRLGYMDSQLCVENALAAQSAGAHWLTVHARTKKDGYKPPAHWEKLQLIKEEINIPLIANGDIWSFSDSVRCRQTTGCEHLMMGRGAVAHPFLASQVRSNKESDQNFAFGRDEENWQALRPWLFFFAKESSKIEKSGFATARCKQWLRLLGRNYPHALRLFEEIKREKDFAKILNLIESSFQEKSQSSTTLAACSTLTSAEKPPTLLQQN